LRRYTEAGEGWRLGGDSDGDDGIGDDDDDDGHGRAVQVDPIKPKLKPAGTKPLKLKWDVLLSTSVFEFNWRRYMEEEEAAAAATAAGRAAAAAAAEAAAAAAL
jgi:hypothetical protein